MKKITQILKKRQRDFVLGGSLALASGASHAALPAAVGTAFTGMQTDFDSLMDSAWPFIISVTVAFIIVRLFKRSAGAAG